LVMVVAALAAAIWAGGGGAGADGAAWVTDFEELLPGVTVTGGGTSAGVAGSCLGGPGGGLTGGGGLSACDTALVETFPSLAPALDITWVPPAESTMMMGSVPLTPATIVGVMISNFDLGFVFLAVRIRRVPDLTRSLTERSLVLGL
jgi:hypothetical protein